VLPVAAAVVQSFAGHREARYPSPGTATRVGPADRYIWRAVFAPSDLSPRARAVAAAAIHRSWAWVATVGCVGPEDARGRRFHSMGAHSCICFPPGSVFGEAGIRIGTQTLIGPYVSLSAGMPGDPAPLDRGRGRFRGRGRGGDRGEPVVDIGDRCSIGRGTSIVGVRHIEIGDDVAIGPNVYITDHNHRYDDITEPIAGQWLAEDSVRIGAGSWLGTGVIVLPGSDIGAHVAVAAGSVVRGPIPDRSVVAGAPARVVRQYSAEEGWIPPLRPRPSPVTIRRQP
jgi:acetyltransferase-like isoleucine patch superfamily enzyme